MSDPRALIVSGTLISRAIIAAAGPSGKKNWASTTSNGHSAWSRRTSGRTARARRCGLLSPPTSGSNLKRGCNATAPAVELLAGTFASAAYGARNDSGHGGIPIGASIVRATSPRRASAAIWFPTKPPNADRTGLGNNVLSDNTRTVTVCAPAFRQRRARPDCRSPVAAGQGRGAGRRCGGRRDQSGGQRRTGRPGAGRGHRG